MNNAIGTGGLSGNPQDTSLPTDLDTQVNVLQDSLRQFEGHGMRPWIDTALHYGAGNALTAVGLALDEHPDKNVVLSFKVGRILEEPTPDRPYEQGDFRGEGKFNRTFDYSREGIQRAFEQSFEFLNKGRKERGWPPIQPGDLDTIVFVHDPEQGTHGEKTPQIVQQVRDEALPALNELKASGKIKAIGIGTNEIACARNFVDHPNLDIVMVAGRLTLLSNGSPEAPDQIKQDNEGLSDLLKEVRKYNKHFISAAPGQSGLLYEDGKWYNYAPASQEIIEFKDKIKEVCDKHSTPLSTAALQFPGLAGASAIVCGICSSKELENNLEDFSQPIPKELWAELKSKKVKNSQQSWEFERFA